MMLTPLQRAPAPRAMNTTPYAISAYIQVIFTDVHSIAHTHGIPLWQTPTGVDSGPTGPTAPPVAVCKLLVHANQTCHWVDPPPSPRSARQGGGTGPPDVAA